MGNIYYQYEGSCLLDPEMGPCNAKCSIWRVKTCLDGAKRERAADATKRLSYGLRVSSIRRTFDDDYRGNE